ncbi:MAG: hypothetical protein IPK13_26745 [Deltaproteobacteria bacterium]|nr:hypothetical protein [Deltaproteobacteria bacterium]
MAGPTTRPLPSSTPVVVRRALGLALSFAAAMLVGCGGDAPGGTEPRVDPVGDAAVPDAALDDGGAGRDGATLSDSGTARDADTDADAGNANDHDGGDSPGPRIDDPNNAHLDFDCDGLSNAYEFATIYSDGRKTDPAQADTDGDGLLDGIELGTNTVIEPDRCAPMIDLDPSTTTRPTVADTDGDTLMDGVEDINHNGKVDDHESNPRFRDSDGDGIEDAVEDRNHNGLRDIGELDPSLADTDLDLIFDGIEDANRDGQFDPAAGETSALEPDTDQDGLIDGEEDSNQDGLRQPHETDPRTPDTDCDGLSDRDELDHGTSPVLADTDHDGIPDAVEIGATRLLRAPGCGVLAPTPDADPGTTTNPRDADSDHDGIQDGVEDANSNGRVDPQETDPNALDSDGDGLSDGDEIALGSDPTNPAEPGAGSPLAAAHAAVCADDALKTVRFQRQSSWTWVTEGSGYDYRALSATSPGLQVTAATLTSVDDEVAAFIVRMPPIAGLAVTPEAQANGVTTRIQTRGRDRGLDAFSIRTTPRVITSHDGFRAAVSGIADVRAQASQNVGSLRQILLSLSADVSPTSFQNWPATFGTMDSSFVFTYEVLVRTSPYPTDEILVVGALARSTVFSDPSHIAAVRLGDLTNGTSLALETRKEGKGCDPFDAGTPGAVDFIWMSDTSGSTDDDRGRVQAASVRVAEALAANDVDFRMGVVVHSRNDHRLGPGRGGTLVGDGFLTPDRMSLFPNYLGKIEETGCEFGLEAMSNAIRNALPRSAPQVVDPRKLRSDATLAVVYISDEFAQEITVSDECGTVKYGGWATTYWVPSIYGCDTNVGEYYLSSYDYAPDVCREPPNTVCVDQIVAPYIEQITDLDGIAFAQIIQPKATPTSCTEYACSPGAYVGNEPGRGYVEVVDATGGTTYSPCNDDPGTALETIVDAVTGISSSYQLKGRPISATLKVGVLRAAAGAGVSIVPRSTKSGFDYDPVANAVFFRGATYRPRGGDKVIVSYRVFRPDDTGCGPCGPNQECDETKGMCVCSASACGACGAGEVCDPSTCACTCATDCNGQCGAGEVCNPSTCTCECAPDCGGACPDGTACDPTTCTCTCGADCGGACGSSLLSCDSAQCACECEADCGGACTGNTMCNASSCACTCAPDCDASCPGLATCDLGNDCGCVCPDDCGGCPASTHCNEESCACECEAGCDAGCPNREVCDPTQGCGCACPPDCGGCDAGSICDPMRCECIPTV